MVAPLAKNNLNYQLDQRKIDSLRNSYIIYKAALNNTIFNLNDLGEFDSSFEMINNSVKSPETTRNAYDSTIPVYLDVYKIGLKGATPVQKGILNDASKNFKTCRFFIISRRKKFCI